MPDIASISAGIESVKLALNIAKDLKTATAAYTEAETRLKLSELYINLSDARISLADAQEEIHDLKNQIRELNEKLNSSDELEYKNGLYYRKVEISGKPNGPFCPKCYEGVQKKMATVHTVSGPFATFGNYKCTSCDSFYRA
ncbi:hypothetical protein ACVST0_18110 [Yersinia enterocolitica]|uniref:hypothetical protein n=1 Tax=Yersinia TaxID=629 RepID=UPI000975ED2E|nr:MULTISPECIES: hypothetical protein [Yersinia]MCE3106952.1 hypothetical protein [Yersinia enterocolitica]MCF3928703.1 hypothetical protein [Yersinia enterocolitica]MDN0104723.1 hypothetical protein [Yersinia bercovieri]